MFLKPEFKGKKFAADVRPTEIAALVPAWSLERALGFARKLLPKSPEVMMLQVDGSPHDSLQGRGPRLCLIGAIDGEGSALCSS